MSLRTVRPDVLDDVFPALVALDADLFGAEAWDAAGWQGLVGTPGRRLTVVEDAGVLVAYALVGLVGDFAELLRIGVAPAARRRGLAAGLLAAAVDVARADGADRMLLEVSEANDGARALYESVGFAPIDRRPAYYRDGTAALVLQLDLSSDLTPADDHPQGRMDP